MSDADIVAGFEQGTLSELPHRDHVRLAWLYLRRDPLWAALPRYCGDLRRFAERMGKPGLYHETVTWAYLLLIHERRQQRPAEETWEEFVAANGDLLRSRPSVLDRYYRAETLSSDRARRSFVLPDRLGSPNQAQP
jgi:hypothetical protein